MMFAQKIRAAKRAMKMSRLHPARGPSFPMKILSRADGCVGIIGIFDAGETGSVGISAVSLFKGGSLVTQVHLSP